jgi:Eukaryotic aspartyl protease
VQIGTPPQVVRVLMSSSGSSLWVPLPEGCLETDSRKCPQQRGGLFNYNDSSTWDAVDLYELPLQAESSLGYSGNSLVGFDEITLGWSGSGGPSLNKTVVTGIATKDFFLGQLGLTSRPVNISGYDDRYSSPLSSLFQAGEIPSLSWSYTAGAPYRQNKAYGSLTLGGYDGLRCDRRNKLTCKMGVDTSRDLLVAITSISSDGTSLLNSGIYAFIDSTVPHIWLPLDVCAAFEEVFGLVYDNASSLYLVDDSLHKKLVRSNASVTISLAASLPTEAETVPSSIDIILPYGAFDLLAGYPLASSTDINATSRYFPLRRASNSSQYTLGRAFLQEAYLQVDYGRSTFALSQTQFPTDPADPGKIIAIYPDKPENETSNDRNRRNESSSQRSNLDPRTIAGITIGAILAAAATIATTAYLHRHLRRRRALATTPHPTDDNDEQTTVAQSTPPEHLKAELAGDSAIWGHRPCRSRIFLDGQEVLPTPTTSPASELATHRDDGAPLACELAGDGGRVTGPRAAAELDAVNREIRELPVTGVVQKI